MPTDLTGTPTTLGIGTYNVTADAPSGLGFNAAMGQIDTLIGQRVTIPSGIATGEVAVWNGSAFVRSSVTNINASNIAPGSNGQVLTTTGGVATWGSAGTTLGYSTTLPGSPTDGQETVLVDSTTSPTYQWRFRYNAGSSNTDKWEFIGGEPLLIRIDTPETIGSTSAYVDLATVGPQFTAPRAGVYNFAYSSGAGPTVNTAGIQIMIALHKNNVLVTNADASEIIGGASGYVAATISTVGIQVSGIAASDVLKVRYQQTGANGTQFGRRVLRVAPVRVS